MVVEWKLKPPNIVISVLNGITNHKPFKSQKMIDALGSGIKKVCYLRVVRHSHIYLTCLDSRLI